MDEERNWVYRVDKSVENEPCSLEDWYEVYF